MQNPYNKNVNKILMSQSHGLYDDEKENPLKQKFVDEHIGPSKNIKETTIIKCDIFKHWVNQNSVI